MQLPHYKSLFDVHIRHDSKAKEFFQTTAGGAVYAAGSTGTITGFDCGAPGLDRFSGALIIDDAIKIDDGHSETVRESVLSNYRETLQQRARGVNVPFVFIGQRVHEDDLANYLIEGKDGYEWTKVILKSLDEAGNALYPEVHPKSFLLKKREVDPYVYSSQYQQDPIDASSSLYKKEWFVLLDEEPIPLYTFIVADTAETSKSYNDATVFSFFSVYEIETFGRKTGEYGIHCIDSVQMRIEPKDLKDAFLDFWQECMRYQMPPKMAAIEKKSTGTMLISLLEEIRTIRIVDIPRSAASGSKTKRFLEVQPYIAERRVSFPKEGKHTTWCIEHMIKIAANESHRFDDFADTLSDSIKLALIDKSLISGSLNQQDYKSVGRLLNQHTNTLSDLRKKAYHR